MRLKAEAVFEFGAGDDQQQNKIVREYRNQYKVVSEILDEHPEILEMAHRDLAKLSKATSRRGRKADFTSENRSVRCWSCNVKDSTTARRRCGSPKVIRCRTSAG